MKKEHDRHILDKAIGLMLAVAFACVVIASIFYVSGKAAPTPSKKSTHDTIKTKASHMDAISISIKCNHCGWANEFSLFQLIDTTKIKLSYEKNK